VIDAAEHSEALLAVRAIACRVVDELSATEIGIPGEANCAALPVASRLGAAQSELE
jgi:hypothetical protein